MSLGGKLALTLLLFWVVSLFGVTIGGYEERGYFRSNSIRKSYRGKSSGLEKLQCLPSGYPCVPPTRRKAVIQKLRQQWKQQQIEQEELYNEISDYEGVPFKKSLKPFPTWLMPMPCCTKCLYEPGWIDAICE